MPNYPAPNPGAYNRRITIQQEAPVTVDALLTPVMGWSTVVQAWASLTPKTYRAIGLDNQPLLIRQAQYVTRRIPSTPIQLGMRLVDSTTADATQTYTILDVQPYKGGVRELLLLCQLVLPDKGV